MPLPGDTKLIASVGRMTEITVVVWLAFGAFIYRSTLAAVAVHGAKTASQAGTQQGSVAFTDQALQQLYIGELTTGLLIVGGLALRGWTARRYGLSITLRSTMAGFALGSTAYLLSWGVLIAVYYGFSSLQTAAATHTLTNLDVLLPTMLITSGINGVYEELFLCGYLMNAFGEGRWRLVAGVVSMLIRVSYHTYQGTYGVINVLIFGGILTLYAARRRQIWPLIVAHIGADVAGFLTMASG